MKWNICISNSKQDLIMELNSKKHHGNHTTNSWAVYSSYEERGQQRAIVSVETHKLEGQTACRGVGTDLRGLQVAAVAQCADRVLKGGDGCATTAGKWVNFLWERWRERDAGRLLTLAVSKQHKLLEPGTVLKNLHPVLEKSEKQLAPVPAWNAEDWFKSSNISISQTGHVSTGPEKSFLVTLRNFGKTMSNLIFFFSWRTTNTQQCKLKKTLFARNLHPRQVLE